MASDVGAGREAEPFNAAGCAATPAGDESRVKFTMTNRDR